MRSYKKINVISDIHGYYYRLVAASKTATKDQPLFVLGDLFDHYFGDERKIIELVLKLHEEERLVFILGNHDLIIQLAFTQIFSVEESLTKLTKEKNIRKFKIFKTIFSPQFFEQFMKIKDRLLEAEIEDEIKLNRYYQEVAILTSLPENQESFSQLQTLLAIGKKYDQVEVNGRKLLLSHSGNIDDPSSRDTAKSYYQLNEKYDYGIMGHLTITAVKQMIAEEEGMLNFNQYFTMNPQLPGLTINGTYMYNSHSKMIMIDNGSFQQRVVTVQ